MQVMVAGRSQTLTEACFGNNAGILVSDICWLFFHSTDRGGARESEGAEAVFDFIYGGAVGILVDTDGLPSNTDKCGC